MVSTRETRLIGPYDASEAGRLNTPTPMIDPSTNEMASGRPSDEPASVVGTSVVPGLGWNSWSSSADDQLTRSAPGHGLQLCAQCNR